MAKITQLYKTPPHGDGGMEEYKRKLFRHRAGLGVRLLICAAVVLAVALGVWFWFRNRTYTAYEVVSSVEYSSAIDTQYAEYNGQLLRYSRDGVSCINSQNEAVWSQTYNMQYPVVDICESSVAVADQQGNEVYVFGPDGLRTQITTLLPIQQISVSSQGVTALLLNDSTVSWIYLYDAEGNVLAESRCSLDETGQPLSISISSDGTKLAVSYLQVQDGSAGSCVVFYNFGSVGTNFVDKIVSSRVYADLLIPRVEYLGSSVCAAVSDQGIIFYEGAEIPEESTSVTVNAEIRSIFFGTDRVGIITEGEQLPEETQAEDSQAEQQDGTTDVEDVQAEQTQDEQAQDEQTEEASETDEAQMEETQTEDTVEETENTGGQAGAEETDASVESENTQGTDTQRNSGTGEAEAGRYQVNIYDTNGRVLFSRRTDLDYAQASLSRNMLILYNGTECEIYSEQGVLKYAGTFDTEISALYKASGFCRYIVVFSDRTDTIRLK